MRCLCLIDHEQPGDETGKFTRYEAGKEYDLDDPEPGLFRAVHGIGEQAVDSMQHTGEGKKSKRQ